jgi:hypothetical protein
MAVLGSRASAGLSTASTSKSLADAPMTPKTVLSELSTANLSALASLETADASSANLATAAARQQRADHWEQHIQQEEEETDMAILRNAWSLRSENLWCAGIAAGIAISAAILPNCLGDVTLHSKYESLV